MKLTKKLLLKIADAVGDGNDWPKHIENDPVASYYLDVLMEASTFEELEDTLQEAYKQEAITLD